MENEMIQVEEGRITIRYGLDENGEPTWHVGLQGDLRYLTALGLIEEARQTMPELYDLDDYLDDE